MVHAGLQIPGVDGVCGRLCKEWVCMVYALNKCAWVGVWLRLHVCIGFACMFCVVHLYVGCVCVQGCVGVCMRYLWYTLWCICLSALWQCHSQILKKCITIKILIILKLKVQLKKKKKTEATGQKSSKSLT